MSKSFAKNALKRTCAESMLPSMFPIMSTTDCTGIRMGTSGITEEAIGRAGSSANVMVKRKGCRVKCSAYKADEQ